MPDIVVIDQQIQDAAAFVIRYLVVLAAAGAFAMALVELGKKLCDWRTRFHAREVTRWLVPTAERTTSHAVKQAPVAESEAHLAEAPGEKKSQPLEAYAQLLQLCSGVTRARARQAAHLLKANGGLSGFWLPPVPEHAPFGQELEVMTTHFQDAIDMAINTPVKYEALFRFATSGAGTQDVEAWLQRAKREGKRGQPATDASAKQHAELFSRLHQAARRHLDAFGLFTGTRWVNRQQLAANVLGAIVLYAAMVATEVNWPEALLVSALGGVLAPVAKDVIVALEKVRQR